MQGDKPAMFERLKRVLRRERCECPYCRGIEKWKALSIVIPDHVIKVELPKATLRRLAKEAGLIRYEMKDKTVVLTSHSVIYWCKK